MKYLVLLLLSSCSWFISHPDNFVEEIVEEGIKDATGMDVELSAENDKR